MGCGGVIHAPLYSVDASRLGVWGGVAVGCDFFAEIGDDFGDGFARDEGDVDWADVGTVVVVLAADADVEEFAGGTAEGEPAPEEELVNGRRGICKIDVAPEICGILNVNENGNGKKKKQRLEIFNTLRRLVSKSE